MVVNEPECAGKKGDRWLSQSDDTKQKTGAGQSASPEPASSSKGKKGLLPYRFLRVLFQISIFVIALLSLIGAGLYAYIQHQGGVKRWAEQALSVPELGMVTRIENVSLHLDVSHLAFEAHFTNAKVSLDAQSVTVPHLEVRVSPATLARGQFASTLIDGVDVSLLQEGETLRLAGNWSALFARLSQQSGNEVQARNQVISLLANREIIFRKARVTLRKEGSSSRIGFEDITAQMSLDTAGNAQVTGQMVGLDAPDSHVKFSAAVNLLTLLSDVKLDVTKLPTAPLADFVPAALAPLSQLGVIEGTLSLISEGQLIQSATATMRAREGSLPIFGGRSEAYAVLGGQISYSRADDYLTVSDVALILQDGRKVTFGGNVAGLAQDITGLSGSVLVEDLQITSLLAEWPEAALPAVRAYMVESFSSGAFETLAVTFEGQFNKRAQTLTLSELSLNGEIDDVEVATGYGQYEALTGLAKGRLSVDVGAGGKLTSAKMKLSLSDGAIKVAGRKDAILFEKAAGEVIYEPGRVSVPDARFTFSEASELAASLSMSLDEALHPQVISVAAQAPLLPIEDVISLWPQDVAPSTLAYIRKSLTGGDVSDFDMQLDLSLPADNASSKITIDRFDAELDIVGTEFAWLAGQPPLQDVGAHVSLHDNVVTIDVQQGAHDRLALQSSTLYINPALQPAGQTRLLTLKLKGEAPAEEIVQILGAPQINQLENIPINISDLSGDVRASVHLTGSLANRKAKFQLVSADATLTQGALSNIFQEFDVSDADLVLALRPGRVDISGAAKVDEVAGDFSLSLADNRLRLSGQMSPHARLAELAATFSGQEITGEIGGRFALATTLGTNQEAAQEAGLYITADLAQAGVNVPLLNWAKLPGETGQFASAFRFVNGGLRDISNIAVDAGGLRGQGVIQFDQAGRFAKAQFDNVSWPGNKLSQLEIIPQKDGGLSVTGEGDLLDLRALRQGDGLSEGRQIAFDMTANRLLVETDIDLYGRMVGEVQKDGNGEATLEGSLIIKGKPLLEQGTVTAIFGPGGEYLSAVGLIGGAEARLEYSPSEDDDPLLIITSQNAGRVLSGLGVTDTIRSGRLVLVNEFKNGSFTDYDTTINLEEFNVIEAPAAVRAFSVLGLAGLYSLVEGDGTRFTRGEAEIQTRGKAHQITHMTASGGAVGVTLLGKYNSDTKQVDVSGNLVPVNQFSKIIGAVPILGQLLSGIDKSGVFATQFNVTGPIEDPDTSVNVASLAPGLIRDLFSPDWLGKERERIIGDNETLNAE